MIDGSRISFNLKYNNIIVGSYIDYDNIMWLNPLAYTGLVAEESEEVAIKELCSWISHEFLHMWLHHTISSDAGYQLDNICENTDQAHTECGGL